jgi:hypothetical protein
MDSIRNLMRRDSELRYRLEFRRRYKITWACPITPVVILRSANLHYAEISLKRRDERARQASLIWEVRPAHKQEGA